MKIVPAAAAAAASLALYPHLAAAADRSGEAQFRAIYKELVETNTAHSAGSCTLAAERMAARLKGAGFPDADVQVLTVPDHPKEGSLVAIYPGRYRLTVSAQSSGGTTTQTTIPLTAGVGP